MRMTLPEFRYWLRETGRYIDEYNRRLEAATKPRK